MKTGMFKINKSLFTILILIFSCTACTMEKRVHSRGFYISYSSIKKQKKSCKSLDLKEKYSIYTALNVSEKIIKQKPVNLLSSNTKFFEKSKFKDH